MTTNTGALELPLFLAGPIIRRAEPTAIWVWICTSKDIQLEAFAFESTSANAEAIGGGIATTIKAGQNCFVHLIEISPYRSNFPQQRRIYYDLRKADNISKKAVFSGWSLESWLSIRSITKGAPDERLPGLYLNNAKASGKNHLRGFFSSCRMAAGEGADAMTLAQELWSKNFNRRNKDDSFIFHINLMMGDQIYADDVDNNVRSLVRLLAPLLIGRDEMLSFSTFKLKEHLRTSSDEKLRKRLLEGIGFTSEALGNHCVLYGEYIALYCLCFSTESLDGVFGISRKGEALRNWCRGKEALRTIFANVPTYFQLDDHEVTDDWNFDNEWQKKTCSSEAQQILSHAITAYFLFQGWGNEPKRFASVCASASEQLDRYTSPSNTGSIEFPRLQAVNGHWDYETPTVPVMHVLDTRTYRTPFDVNASVFDESSTPGSPVKTYQWVAEKKSTTLFSDVAMRALDEKLKRSSKTYPKACIIVSPCAVFSADAQKTAASISSKFYAVKELVYGTTDVQKAAASTFSNYFADAEDWDSSHPYSIFQILLPIIGKFRTAYFLSGDIHYGYKSEGDVYFNGFPELRVVEAVSSPSCNKSKMPPLGTKKFDKTTQIARWYDDGRKMMRSAYDELIAVAAQTMGTPTILVKTNRLQNLYGNNIGVIEVLGDMPIITLHS